MKTKTKALSAVALGLLAVLGVSAYTSGSLENLQGRFGATGGVTFSVASDTPRTDIVVAGSDVEVSKYSVTATKEDFMIDKLSIENKNSTTDHDISAVTLSYRDVTGATVSSTGYLVSGVATFTGLSAYVTKDASTNLDISVDLNPISSSGSSATSGDRIQLYLGTTGFDAVGQTSGKTAVSYAGTNLKTTNYMQVYETKPTLSLDASSPSGGRSVSTSDNAFIFDVAADLAEKVEPQKIIVDLASDSDFATTAAVTATLTMVDSSAVVTTTSAPVTFTDASHAKITFDTRGVGEVNKGSSTSFTVNLDTFALLDEDSGVDDPLTFSITYGTSVSGTVTPGGFWWSDTNTVAKWVGNVTSTSLLGNTLTY